MAIHLTINISDADGPIAGTSTPAAREPSAGSLVAAGVQTQAEEIAELRAQLGDHIAPFPPAGIDGFLSHFIITLRFTQTELAGRVMNWTSPPAVQTVTRSDPFVYNRGKRLQVKVPLPSRCTLPDTISEEDFFVRPEEYFVPGQETVWMQILNLDARMETELGPVRIILGETLKRQYPDLFLPSLGVATSLGRRGFPARLFFNPVAVVETPLGAFRSVHGTLAYGRIVAFPPVATPVSIQGIVPLEPVESLRRVSLAAGDTVEPAPAEIIALSHPISTSLQIPGEDAFNLVEGQIGQA
jgi:hypothetical protein